MTFDGRFSLAPEKAVRPLRVEWICTEVHPAIEIVLRTAVSDFLWRIARTLADVQEEMQVEDIRSLEDIRAPMPCAGAPVDAAGRVQ